MRSFLLALLLAWGGLIADIVAAAPPPVDSTVEVFFTPWDDAEGAIVRAVAGARQSIHVQAYLITSHSIAVALLAAAGRGVVVEILADREMAIKGTNSQLRMLVAAGIPVWLETRYAAAHNKVMVIDAVNTDATKAPLIPAVITGSYNYTWSAQARNAENLLLIRGNPELTKRYLDNWRRHRLDAQAWSDEGLK